MEESAAGVAIGIEVEFGHSSSREVTCRDVWTQNGGRMYHDCSNGNGPIEIALGEARGPITATICALSAYRSIVEYPWFEKDIRFYSRNSGWEPQSSHISSGNHESYSISDRISSVSQLEELVPFLVSRTLISGTGYVNNAGNYELSQRARFIDRSISRDTMGEGRGIVCTREFDSSGNRRLHLISGESTMNHGSTFLKIGSTALMIEMLSMGEVPDFDFDSSRVVRDLKKISESSSQWLKEGVQDPKNLGL